METETQAELNGRSLALAAIAGACNIALVWDAFDWVPHDAVTLWNTLVHGSFLLMPLMVVIFYRRIIQVTSTFAALLAIALIMSIGRADLIMYILMYVQMGIYLISAFFLLLLTVEPLDILVERVRERIWGAGDDR